MDEMLQVDDALAAALVLTADEPDAHPGTDQLEKPSRRHHLHRGHAKDKPWLAHAGHYAGPPTGDRDPRSGSMAPDGRHENSRRGT